LKLKSLSSFHVRFDFTSPPFRFMMLLFSSNVCVGGMTTFLPSPTPLPHLLHHLNSPFGKGGMAWIVIMWVREVFSFLGVNGTTISINTSSRRGKVWWIMERKILTENSYWMVRATHMSYRFSTVRPC
jgi:hypothetical protein